MSAEPMSVCSLCGFAFEPGGAACAARGCPFAGAGCRTLDCPRCGYAVPDEDKSRLARWVRRLFARTAAVGAPRTLADLASGQDAVLDGIEGEPALAARLTAQGLASGVAIHLLQRHPSYVIEVGEATLAVERSVARVIRIRSAGSAST
jgi:Fe2+ transport system protein FeoA